MQVIFRPEAQAELLEARAWYEGRSSGLGSEFARAVDAAVAKALRSPRAFQTIDETFRQVAVRKFPYVLIYTATDTELIVVSCFHYRRKPGSWRPPSEQSPKR